MCGIEGKSATPSFDPPPLPASLGLSLCAKGKGGKEKMAKIKAIFYPKPKCLGEIYVQQVHTYQKARLSRWARCESYSAFP